MLLIGLISVSCASQSAVPPPDWSQAKRPQKEITYAHKLPDLCEMPGDSGRWPAPCWLALDEYDIIATFNTELADLNASALRKTELGYDSLQQAGQLQQQLSDYYRDLLKEERRGRFIDGLMYKALIGLGVIGAAL